MDHRKGPGLRKMREMSTGVSRHVFAEGHVFADRQLELLELNSPRPAEQVLHWTKHSVIFRVMEVIQNAEGKSQKLLPLVRGDHGAVGLRAIKRVWKLERVLIKTAAKLLTPGALPISLYTPNPRPSRMTGFSKNCGHQIICVCKHKQCFHPLPPPRHTRSPPGEGASSSTTTFE